MAVVAHIQGVVTLGFTITETGTVANLRAISGHPILLQAALDAVKDWTFEPFLINGKPVGVRSRFRVVFAQGRDAEVVRRYYFQEGECSDLLRIGRYGEAEPQCNEALKISANLSNDHLKMNANGNAGNAAYHLGKGAQALEYFQQQLKIAAKMLPKDATGDWADIYRNLAHGYRATGQLSEADSHWKQAETVMEAEIKAWEHRMGKHPDPADLRWRAQLNAGLRQALTEHASYCAKWETLWARKSWNNVPANLSQHRNTASRLAQSGPTASCAGHFFANAPFSRDDHHRPRLGFLVR